MPSKEDAAQVGERRQLAFELRKAGTSYRNIGRQLGITHTSAKRYVDCILDALHAASLDSAERYRSLQLERLNDMLFALWPAVKRGDTASIREARGIMEREAKLMGLDAPERMDMFVSATSKALAEEFGLDAAEVVDEARRLLSRNP